MHENINKNGFPQGVAQAVGWWFNSWLPPSLLAKVFFSLSHILGLGLGDHL